MAQDLCEEPPFRSWPKQWSREERGRRERRRDETAAHENVARGARVGVQELILQPQRFDQFKERPGREKTLRAKFEVEAIFLDRFDHAAGACARLEHTHWNSRS